MTRSLKIPGVLHDSRSIKMTSSNNLVVPLVMWGKSAPGHCVSCVYLLRDQKTMVTGSYDGQVGWSNL